MRMLDDEGVKLSQENIKLLEKCERAQKEKNAAWEDCKKGKITQEEADQIGRNADEACKRWRDHSIKYGHKFTAARMDK